MQSDFHIRDLIYQDGDRVVYRAHTSDGASHDIIRMKFPIDCLAALTEGGFQRAFEELLSLEHSNLRPVVDGGLDPVDHYPWVAVRAWDGPSLNERLEVAPLSSEEIDRLESQATALIEFMGGRSGAISLAPRDIVTSSASDGQTIDTFAINYWTWFNDRAESRLPCTGKSSSLTLYSLIKSLRPAGETKVVPAPAPTERILPSPPPARPYLPPPKNSTLKPILVCLTLLSLVIGGIWLSLNRQPGTPPAASQVTTELAKAPPPSAQNKFYTIKDEEELREMTGQTITLMARVADFIQSDSGKNLYLVFHDRGPGFRAGVEVKEAEPGLDETYLRQFVGKAVLVTGRLETEKASGDSGKRLVIRFKRKTHLEPVE